MNNDFYAEQLISKNSSGGDTVKKILIGLATTLAAIFIFGVTLVLFPVNLLLIGFVFYGGYYFMTGVDTEYEYILTNGDLDIDKIIGKRKRKRLITANISEFTAFGKLSEAGVGPEGATTVLVTDGTEENAYYADFRHQSAGNVRLIFMPNEKMLNGIALYLPRQLKAEFNRNRAKY